MKKKRRNPKQKKTAFTLIELLVVVFIIAVMASLIIPRMTGQTEKAIISEAQQMLGTIRRAQAAYMDSTGNPALSFTYAAFSSGGNSPVGGNTVGGVPTQWTQLGFQPLNANTKFSYACNITGCTATRIGGTHNGAQINLNYATGNFACGTGYVLLDSADRTKGCAP